ncbi:LysM peptidoglycan-binding domain-containing protein [Sulfitobacter sp. D35]|uniref:LysM peptidoglycan-binding domain-containing protein n=1 Tax=Sulfitobacter sp. D35 TaxID=3083252 RepID=UPI00296FA108|nr:LysM peptidoglycan-binding domain-containing protein [Sulfitobacter sp. D35]MDW4497033.1 LysM peptidoglycan-binding domain-containing protein [Sulfitobacter sp. D35]
MTDQGPPAARWAKGLLLVGAVAAAGLAAAWFGGLRDATPDSQATALPVDLAGGGGTEPGALENDDAVAQTPSQTAATPGEASDPVLSETVETDGADAEVAGSDPETEQAESGLTDSAAVETAEAGEGEDTVDSAPLIEDVRLEADGLAVIAGRAEPGSTVSVEVNGVGATETQADARGQFAAIAMIAPDGSAPVLTLTQKGAGGTTSSSAEVILAPVGGPSATGSQTTGGTEEVAALAAPVTASPPAQDNAGSGNAQEATASNGAIPETGEVSEDDAAAGSAGTQAEPAATPVATARLQKATTPPAPSQDGTESVADADAPDAASQEPQAPAPGQGAADTVAAVAVPETRPTPAEPEGAEQIAAAAPAPKAPVAVLKSDEDGVEVLQNLPRTLENVVLDTIGYSERGEVQLSGRAEEKSDAVRVYLDNRAIVTLPVDAEGRWRGDLPEVDSGLYTLRVDAVDDSGDVISRVETPFKRETPEVLAAASDGSDGPVTAVTVQTGDTLWAIARGRYGEGVLFVKVFEANRQAIRDPDLIYPGQVFDLPD